MVGWACLTSPPIEEFFIKKIRAAVFMMESNANNKNDEVENHRNLLFLP